MKRLTNQESRVVQHLVNRKKISTQDIARVTCGTYKQGANLLIRMEKKGALLKLKRGVYALRNKENVTLQTEIKFKKQPTKTTPEMLAKLKRMRDIRERNRQERIIKGEEIRLKTSRVLVGYKLIKQYPHSPYQLDEIFDTTDSGDYTLFEMYPENWQPVYKVIKPEPKQLTEEQNTLIKEATEYVSVAMALIKKIESLNNTNN